MHRSNQYMQDSTLGTLALIALFIAIPFMAPVRVNAQSGLGQRVGLSANYTVGESAYASTPDPALGPSEWAAGPVGITNYGSSGFIESGPIKNYNNDQAHIPYGTAIDGNGDLITYFMTATRLAANGTYFYKIVKFSSTGYQSQACYGNGICEGMVTSYTSQPSFKYAGAGNESSMPSVLWGTQGSLYNTYTDTSGATHPWCYVTSVGNVGTISGCYNGGSGYPDSWQTYH